MTIQPKLTARAAAQLAWGCHLRLLFDAIYIAFLQVFAFLHTSNGIVVSFEACLSFIIEVTELGALVEMLARAGWPMGHCDSLYEMFDDLVNT